MELGDARGWQVWPLKAGDWAWTAWTAATDRRSGIEPTEAEAESAAQQALQGLVADAAAGALSRRELHLGEGRREQWDPQS